MGKITFVEIKDRIVGCILFLAVFFVYGLASLYGRTASIDTGIINLEPVHIGNSISMETVDDHIRTTMLWSPFSTVFTSVSNLHNSTVDREMRPALNVDNALFVTPSCDKSDPKADCDGDGVSNGKEKKDGTDPDNPCDFILTSRDCQIPEAWKKLDCDGDGVTNGKEEEDGTDPFDFCSYKPECITLPQSAAYLAADCDGDGVTNGKEKEDNTDPLDPCDLIIAHQNCHPSKEWKELDCDGDGVPNEKEKEDGTDPLDPCSYNPASVTLPQSGAYLTADCDGDGVPNEKEEEDGTDTLDACAVVLCGQQSTTPGS